MPKAPVQRMAPFLSGKYMGGESNKVMHTLLTRCAILKN